MNSYRLRSAAAAVALMAALPVAPGSANVVTKNSPPAARSAARVKPAIAPGCSSNGQYSFVGLSAAAYGANYAGGAATSQGNLGFSGVAAGQGNLACDWDSFIGAGKTNIIGGNNESTYSFVGSGYSNSIAGSYTGSQFSFMGAGSYNSIRDSWYGTIVGGSTNAMTLSAASFIGAGYNNNISIPESFGNPEQPDEGDAFIGAGFENVVSSNSSAIVGGAGNTVSASASGGFIGAGTGNVVTKGGGSAIVSGVGNTTSGLGSAIVAGINNTITSEYASIIGGQQNSVSGAYGTVTGGFTNTASGVQATIGGGYGNIASGKNATIPGGTTNTASGTNSFAAGTMSTAKNSGSFVWSDYVSGLSGVASTGSNQFLARATGGFYLYTSTSLTGVALAPGSGAWSTLSDRNVKTNIKNVDDARILTKLAAMPVSEWSYKAQGTGTRHVGPMAQDFRAAFGLGEDDRHISTVDEEGVALAAIKALHAENAVLRAEHASDEARLARLEAYDAKAQRVAQERLAQLEAYDAKSKRAAQERLAQLETRLDAIEAASHSAQAR